MYLYEKYLYTFPGTNIHWLTFIIIVFELVILLYQIIYYLIRPSDKIRKWYLILLLLLINYNIFGGLFVDPRLLIPIVLQYYLAYGAGILMSMYLPFYIYKFLNVKNLKFFAYWGSFLFLFLPFILTFGGLYAITKDINFCAKWVVAVPAIYAFAFLYALTKVLYNYSKSANNEPFFKEKIIGVCSAVFFWVIGLSIVTFFNGSQYIEHGVTNTGFLIMTVIFIRSTILDSRKEYQKLLVSENELQKNNELLTQKVKERTRELELSNDQKINIFINLAHEIRTPITLINNYLEEYINKHEESEEIRIIKSNIEKLNADIVNSFNEERFLKGLLPDYNYDQVVDFTNLLTGKLALFRQYASNKKITLTEEIEKDLYIKADPDALNSIINNLTENAIKYTPEGGSVKISLTKASDQIQFMVKDNGLGISEDLLEKIFEPYFRVNRENSYSQGMGMGLSIVNNIVKSLRGEVFVKSKETEGSEFTVYLKPYVILNTDTVTSYEPKTLLKINESNNKIEDAVSNNSMSSILIIEDNTEMLLYLRNKLKEMFNIYVAENGKKALLKLKTIQKPDLIISDVMMDEMDGFEFLKAISEDNSFHAIPLIFLTAKTTAANKLKGFNLGAVDYISKPFSISELMSKVSSIINFSHNQKKALLKSAVDAMVNSLDSPKLENESKMGKFDNNCYVFNITEREKEIIELIIDGLSYKEISQHLNLSENTLVKHRTNIFKKVDVNKKSELLSKLFA
jgi:signal transduction histidine kinase/DNA-binding NarL/FixJ family response regulator